jgi:tRNA-specific 2-thiouridylase
VAGSLGIDALNMAPKKIIVGMSGGVDSSVAALRLLEQGYTVEGLFMKNWEQDDDADYCAAAVDLADAQQVCDRLGIKLHSVNFADQYWDRVFQHFLDEYRAGRTPNPDILCNKEIKFKAFLDYALQLGADAIATGHYARVAEKHGEYFLLKGCDPDKDQSYFLYTLGQQQLRYSLFPVGDMQKTVLRNIALQAGLITHNKKDSTGICFIGERKFRDFLQQYLPAQPGDIVDENDHIIGQHHGLMYYTLGQRKGLGIGGIKEHEEQAWYTLHKDMTNNRLIVGQGENNPRLFHNQLQASQLHWVSGQAPDAPMLCKAKVRYRQAEQDCEILQIDNNACTVHFNQPQRAVTPGQSIVFYNNEICLGGGVIDNMSNQ